MGPFDFLQKKGSQAIKPQPASIRKETVSIHSNPRKKLDPTAQRPRIRTVPASKRVRKVDPNVLEPPKTRRQDSRKRQISKEPRLESDSDENFFDEVLEASNKRLRISPSVEPDRHRRLHCMKSLSADEVGMGNMVQAAEIASLQMATKYKPAFPDDLEATHIYLQYPSESAKERFELVTPINSDDFKPLEDIKEVLEIITTCYLPETEGTKLQDDSHGLLRRLKRAIDRLAGKDYTEIIEEWNDTIVSLRNDGTIEKVLNGLNHLDLRLIERILTQTYSRTVSPRIHLLKQYQNGTDNVYGELLPKFVSNILRRDTKLKSNQIFVDLGSGVGNVVLQAALEIGCESWGCEMMDNACDLAELQVKDFRERCRLWGLSAGSIHLERGDFLENTNIGKILQKADVVLVNNQAFTPELNDSLSRLFLDLKEGCRVVSLKSFAPKKITSRNLNSACNVLDVVEKEYYSGSVSWTDPNNGGTYYVSTKDSSKLKMFADAL